MTSRWESTPRTGPLARRIAARQQEPKPDETPKPKWLERLTPKDLTRTSA